MLKSNQQRLFFVLGVISLVPFISISIYGYRYFNSVWIKMNETNIEYLNAQTTGRISKYFLDSVDKVYNWYELDQWKKVLKYPKRLESYVEKSSQETHIINSIFVLNKERKILITNKQNKSGTPNPFKDILPLIENAQIFPDFQSIGTEGVFISRWIDTSIGNIFIKSVMLSFSILDGEDNYIGMLSALIDQEEILKILETEFIEHKKRDFKNSSIALIDSHTGKVLLWVSNANEQPNAIKLPKKISSGDLVTLSNKNWSTFVGSLSFGNNNLQIVSLVSEVDLLQATKKLFYVGTLVFTLSCLIIILLIGFMSRTLSNPITILSAQAENFGKGDYLSPIDINQNTSDEETKKLAYALDTARQNIHSYIEKLKISHNKVQVMADSFARFVPVEFIKSLGKEAVQDIHIGESVQKEITVFFTDIRSFTALSEKMNVDRLFNLLNELFGKITPQIHAHQGFIDKFMGDAIMALFPEKPDHALMAAINIQRSLESYNQERKIQNKVPIQIGMGLNSGSIMLGTVGSTERLDTTVIGDTVNIASRIESSTKYFGVPIILSESTYQTLVNPEQFHLRDIDIVCMKGKQESVGLYELYDCNPTELRILKKEHLSTFQEGVQAYREGDFKNSEKIFLSYTQICSQDNIAQLYLKRCEKHIRFPIEEEWKGITILEEK